MKTSLFKRSLSVVLAAVILSALCLCAFAAEDTDYTIVNPYSDVDWQQWGQYKVNLHCHTSVSDGTNDFAEMIEKHYELGYDALAITDHGTTNNSWVKPHSVPLIGLLSQFKVEFGHKPTFLTQERYEEITTPGADGKMMIRVPYGVENNPTAFNNAHVNSWFCDYGDGVLGGTSDYERPIKGVQEAGGLSVINHPGEYTSAKEEDDPELAYNEDYDYYINKFTSLLLKYDSCIGIDINSKGDSRTRNDRKLWDILLENCIPNGRSVFAIGSSDAHRDSAIDSGWVISCMPNLTSYDLRTSLETGAFFAGSRNIKNSKELSLMGQALGRDFGNEWHAQQGIVQPKVTGISVDNESDSITINAENAQLVRWIAKGEQIACTAADGESISSTLSLDEYSDKIGSYVRAEIFGEGGVLYSQAFVLDYDGAPQAKDFSHFADFGVLVAGLRDILLAVCNVLPLWPLFWKLISGNFTQL